ncbi:uncharacterized protein [Rhodnius prolixus]|uniref:uncharacterized protein n=1 Tax=Rhodnius prolixus TaxID=13249 RepID=UPI003D18EDE1
MVWGQLSSTIFINCCEVLRVVFELVSLLEARVRSAVMYSQLYGSHWHHDDIAVVAGIASDSKRFVCYKKLLMLHSGYIKSQIEAGLTEIQLPNINADIFSIILNYINTGYLELNRENIYAVLLATHLLHIPSALELCRNYLMRQNSSNSTIIKPIPSRKCMPLYWSPPLWYPTVGLSEAPPQPAPSTSTHHPTESKHKVLHRDIACCDGPVRFKKVLNKNYLKNSEKSGLAATAAASKHYVCTFCKHTFKSHYCFRKHTRRHINPVSVESTPPTTASATTTATTTTTTSTITPTLLKDMNVQYYPCKTCGSKFPSYYFVHKHRKLCHKIDINTDKDVCNDN